MTRRKIIWLIAGGFAVVIAGIASLVALPSGVLFFLRRRLPQAIDEPSSFFRVGSPLILQLELTLGFFNRIASVLCETRIVCTCFYARCTHQGCTPDWVALENKFSCPCHESRFCLGSAFDGNGINCEGPALRPLDRVHVEVDSEGQVVADISKLYQWPKESVRSLMKAGLIFHSIKVDWFASPPNKALQLTAR